MAKRKLTDKQAEKLPNFEPAMTDSEMQELEKVLGDDDWGIRRRVCLLAFARSADFLSDTCRQDPDTYGMLLEEAEAYCSHAKQLSELAEGARLRLLVAGARQAKGANHD